jgi:uncharacterized glyoxalase superfamily protein PhnB
MAKPVPDGFHTLCPHIIVRDVAKAIAFYKAAFGAEEVAVHYMPDGKTVMHAQIRIGDSPVLMAEESEKWGCKSPLMLGATPVSLHLYVKDADAAFDRAVKAGATAAMPLADMFWGDRYGKVIDPFGHHWSIATHQKDMTPEETSRAAQEFFARMAQGQGKH